MRVIAHHWRILMLCDWVFRWWIHWCERSRQICEWSGSACYLIHAVSPVGDELNIAGQVVTALSLWPHAYHPSTWRGGGVEQMNRGPRWRILRFCLSMHSELFTPAVMVLPLALSQETLGGRGEKECAVGGVEVWCWKPAETWWQRMSSS